MFKSLYFTATAIALLAVATACDSANPTQMQANSAGRWVPMATHGSPPLTAVSLALSHGASGSHNSVTQPATQHPCPNLHYVYAWYAGPPAGMWTWLCACSCVPSSYGWPIHAAPQNIQALQTKFIGPLHWAASQTDSNNVNSVALASKNFKKQSQLTNGINNVALGLAQDTNGNVYVGQTATNQILVFAAGSTNPTTLTDPNIASVYYVAVDKAGDLFVDGWAMVSGSAVFELDEMKAGSGTFSQLPVKAAFPGGIAVDRMQNLWVDDQGNGSSGTISEYPAPYTKMKTKFSYAGDNTEISIDSSNTELVAANNFIQSSTVYSGIVMYSIPSGKVLSSAAPSPGTLYGVCFKKPTKI